MTSLMEKSKKEKFERKQKRKEKRGSSYLIELLFTDYML